MRCRTCRNESGRTASRRTSTRSTGARRGSRAPSNSRKRTAASFRRKRFRAGSRRRSRIPRTGAPSNRSACRSARRYSSRPRRRCRPPNLRNRLPWSYRRVLRRRRPKRRRLSRYRLQSVVRLRLRFPRLSVDPSPLRSRQGRFRQRNPRPRILRHRRNRGLAHSPFHRAWSWRCNSARFRTLRLGSEDTARKRSCSCHTPSRTSTGCNLRWWCICPSERL